MKSHIITILLAVLVMIGVNCYWNYSTWENIGVDFHYYNGESTISSDNFNELKQNSSINGNIETINILNNYVTIKYKFTSPEKITFLNDTKPSNWDMVRSRPDDNAFISILITLGTMGLGLFVISKRSEPKKEQPKCEPLTNKEKWLAVATLLYAIVATGITVIALIQIIPIWIFPIPFTVTLIAALVSLKLQNKNISNQK